jgi:adenylate cyclase
MDSDDPEEAKVAVEGEPEAMAPGPSYQPESNHGVGILILALYGVEVCPFLAQLTLIELWLILLGGFALVTLIRRPLQVQLDATNLAELDAGQVRFPWRDCALEFGVWAAVGLWVTAFNWWWYGFPVVISGLKLVAGGLVLGIFAAADAGMARRGWQFQWFAAHPGRTVDKTSGTGSVAQRVLLFFLLTGTAIGIVLVMLLEKDMKFLLLAAKRGQPLQFHKEVTIEIVFVGVVLLGAGFQLARRFGRNLEALFALELQALAAVREGRYDVRVPLVTDDEFRVVAQGTNEMVEGLAERERIRQTFGRYLSPTVAEAILSDESGVELGGRQVDVAVLFSDLRNFTPLSERLAPKELVSFLNEYFTEMVAEVHAHGGVVDKFIGDAVMAVYGLDAGEDPCGRAVATALAMNERLAGINAGLEEQGVPPVAFGVGIHFGPVIAGNIGSAERLEYTVIGDAVNVAARLESATKDLGAFLAVSEPVRSRLDGEGRKQLEDLGCHELKGKSGLLQIYGVPSEG